VEALSTILALKWIKTVVEVAGHGEITSLLWLSVLLAGTRGMRQERRARAAFQVENDLADDSHNNKRPLKRKKGRRLGSTTRPAAAR
jgi:hypothetical protein